MVKTTYKRHETANKERKGRWMYLLYLLFFLLVVLYILTNSFLAGASAFILIIIIVVAELRSSVSSEGLKKTLYDVVVSVLAAIVLLWILPSIILQTSAPIDVVASCSMLPIMHRGDLVLLHGIGNLSSFLQANRIPIVNVSQSSFNRMVGNMNSEFVEPFAYLGGNRSAITQLLGDTLDYNLGFYSTNCVSTYSYLRQPYNYYQCYVSPQALSSNLIRYSSSVGNVLLGNAQARIVYTYSIAIANTTITENYGNPIIVYKTTSRDYFTGDIIHRLYAAIRTENGYYLLTKGDNNPVLDIEALNYPVDPTSVIGYVIADIPDLGYPSLIIKGQVGNVPGCNETILRN